MRLIHLMHLMDFVFFMQNGRKLNDESGALTSACPKASGRDGEMDQRIGYHE